MGRPLLRYSVAVVLVGLAIVVEGSLPAFFEGVPFFLFFVVVFFSALLGGFGPGVLATACATFATSWLFHRPLHHLLPGNPIAAAQMLIFALTGTIASWLVSTNLRARQRRTADQFEEFSLLARAAPVMVWLGDARGHCTFVSERWLEFTGRPLSAEQGLGWLERVHPDDRGRVTSEQARAATKREPTEMEYRLCRGDGQYRTVLARSVPRLAGSGSFDGMVSAVVDIEDINAAQRERDQLVREMSRERQRLLDVMSNVPGVVWEAWGNPNAEDQHIDFVSDYVKQMLGYSVEEWLSTPNFWLTIVHPDDQEAAAKNAHDHFLAGGVGLNRFRWMTKDGRAIWCESQSTVVTGDDGQPLGMRGVVLDISARKRAEDTMRVLVEASEELGSSLEFEKTIPRAARMAVEVLGDWCAVSTTGADGEPRRLAVAHCDPAKHILAQELLGSVPRRDLPSAITQSIDQHLPTILNVVPDDFIERTTNGSEHAALVRQLGLGSMLVVPLVARDRLLGAMTFCAAAPGHYTEGDASLALLIARRVAVAIDNAQLYRAAVAASSAKDDFLATVSHELRTPMTATLGWVRLLTTDTLDAETQKTAMDAIERSTRAQAKLVEDILDVSRIILGKFRLESVPVDLHSILAAAIQTLGPAISAKAMSVNVDTSRWHGVVQGDADRLQQVLWNLLSNAIKFSSRGGSIDVILERIEEQARITVRDDGAGIEPHFLPHVFDRFRQAEGGPTRSHGGLGLGLAIVRHLVEMHGGTVQAASDGAGRGSTFVIELPVTIGDSTGEPEQPGALPDLTDKTILVVDDEQPTLDLFSTVLRGCGASVTTALSADSALIALNERHHDLLIADIAMPQTDGMSLLDAIRERTDAHARIPAIAVTARTDLARGPFDRILRKPIDPYHLAHEAALVIARGDTQQELKWPRSS